MHKGLSSLIKRIVGRLSIGIVCLMILLGLIWGSLALFYSAAPDIWLRYILIIFFLLAGVRGLWLIRDLRKAWPWLAVFAGGLLAISCYWATIEPSHDRVWRPDMAQMPRALIKGDKVSITHYRNFRYRSLSDFDVHYETREVDLSHLTSIDFYISYWTESGPVGHTFISFNFDNAPPVNISIEARYEAHEYFDPIGSMFKKYELIYIVGDEYDLVRVRTNFRHERVYRYPLKLPASAARQLFLVYMERINELAVHPEFYHLLSNNCTLNIVRYANRIGRDGGLDVRHLLNGYSDRYLYQQNIIDSTLPFDVLRERAEINDLALAADEPNDFYRRIRQRLPGSNPNIF